MDFDRDIGIESPWLEYHEGDWVNKLFGRESWCCATLSEYWPGLLGYEHRFRFIAWSRKPIEKHITLTLDMSEDGDCCGFNLFEYEGQPKDESEFLDAYCAIKEWFLEEVLGITPIDWEEEEDPEEWLARNEKRLATTIYVTTEVDHGDPR